MITIKNIHKSFGNLHVLKGVNLDIQKGKIVAIVGKSGAGKTTLLQILGTLERPDDGTIIIDNKDVYALNENEIADFRNKHIGFIHQFHQLLPEFNALENVMIPGLIATMKYEDVQNKAEILLTELGLGERLLHKPSELSGGEKQRVALARAMIMSPDVILADEPSGSLDSSNKEELHRLLLYLSRQYKQTIIVVTHDRDLANICDEIIELKDGKIFKSNFPKIFSQVLQQH
jgi:lipoprotein-releasing system ATP-binding protein